MKRKLLEFIFKHHIGIIIFIPIAFLRLFLVPELFYFGIDEEYQSLLAWSVVKDPHPLWIGLSAADTGFYVGPGLVYLHSILLWVSQGDPIILSYAAAILGLVTTCTLYFLTADLFGKKAGQIVMILYGLSSFVMLLDRRFWNPSLAPLISVLMLFFVLKAMKNDRWWIAVACLLGIIVHIHASLFVFFVIIPIIFLYFHQTGSKLRFLSLFLSLLVFLIIYSPLIVYDLAKNFENLKTPFRLLTRDTGQVYESSFSVMSSTFAQALFSSNQVLLKIASMIMVFIALFNGLIRRSNKRLAVLTILTSTYLFLFIIYPGKVLDYYLIGLLPLLFILFAQALTKVPNIIRGSILLIFIVAHVVSFFKRAENIENAGLIEKKRFIERVMEEVDNRSYSLTTPEPYVFQGGWRYLFKTYGFTPETSTADSMFGWIYSEEITQKEPEIRVVIVNPNQDPPAPESTVVQYGSFTAHIIQ